jgi:Divergent InlB B-repeat domain
VRRFPAHFRTGIRHGTAKKGSDVMQRTTFRTRHLLAGALAVAAFGVAPAAARAGTLQVVPVGLGSVTVSPPATTAAPSSPDVASGLCSATGTGGGRANIDGGCALTYPAGTTVTLTASGGPADGDGPKTDFQRWSDDRCPGTGPCTLTLGADDQTVAALFSPQRISVIIAGVGTVTSAPGDLDRVCDTNPCGDFDPDRPVTLTAVPAGATTSEWLASDPDRGTLCDPRTDTTCTVLPAWPRWVSVGFGITPLPSFPPQIDVSFHVGKTGSGSGTVRSGSLNCGGQCTTKAKFGASETFTATPDNGSRFTGWRSACGSAATCRLAVGPVTSLTAAFDKAAGGVAGTGTKNPGTKKKQQQQRRGAFAARVLRIGVSGHGRRRTLSIRLRVNAPASVRARLVRGRRQVASHRWRVRRAGIQVLRMRVPARARAGAYRVRVTIGGRGRTVNATKGVRLRR